ncbi:hypothetical protein BSL78_17972 [Apostichopus japonicus]|uniref:Uncharacterized protein n=1 Tax=Stichopus japonicus TaxID=307972 RepID=A0A2G8KAZ0_STIJA|nr:hypothetical protein BSL78_17972 [Apostichopus japonicus]
MVELQFGKSSMIQCSPVVKTSTGCAIYEKGYRWTSSELWLLCRHWQQCCRNQHGFVYLALFLSPSERQYSLRLTKDSSQFPFKYEADVQLQGFLKTSFEVEDSLLSIMASRYPTSLVDLTTLEVKQMYHYNEHEYMRHEVITKELQHTWLESKEPIPVLRFSKEIETDTLVENFQKEVSYFEFLV